MTISILGELSLADVVPLLVTFKAGLDLGSGISIPDLTAQILGLGNVLAAITVSPPDLAGTITAALATVASLQAAIGGPTVTLQAPAIVAQIAALTVQLGALTAAAALDIPAGTVSLYVFDGASGNIGAELQAAVNGSLPGAPGHANALIIMTTSPADWAACEAVFKTS